jgi:hypothetical protein
VTEFVGRSGADAVYKFLHSICKTLVRYSSKLDTAITLAQSADLITSDQATQARAFIAGADALCDIFLAVSKNSGF